MYPLKKVTWKWCGFDNDILFGRWRPIERHCNHAVCLRGVWEPHPDKRHPPGFQSPAFRIPSRSPAEAIWSSLKVQDVQNWAFHARTDPWQAAVYPSVSVQNRLVKWGVCETGPDLSMWNCCMFSPSFLLHQKHERSVTSWTKELAQN